MTDGCALVAGGTSGIGRATAMAVAARGIPVVAVSRNPTRRQGNGDGPTQGSLIEIAADLTKPDEVDRAFSEAELAYGPIGYVVHSVGHDYEVGWFEAAEPASIQAAVAALITSPALVLNRALTAMKPGGGPICFVSSGAADKPTPGRALYSASKIALNRLVESVSIECEAAEPPIGVFAVLPGRVDTPMQRRLMAVAPEAPAVFRLHPFTSDEHLRSPEELGEGIASALMRPASEVNGRVLRYTPDGWQEADR